MWAINGRVVSGASDSGIRMLVDELLAYLFDGQAHLLATPMAGWLASSRRFTTFVTAFRAKIRKKIRVTHDAENLLDLRLELETAYLLLQEPRFGLVYEPQLGGKTRGPDFAVTYASSVVFMVEVTRLRGGWDATMDTPGIQGPGQAPDGSSVRSRVEERLLDAVCGKLGQMLPQHSNILLVGVEPPGPAQDTLRAWMLHLQQRAERSDQAVVRRQGFRDRADFFHHYHRLSELLVRGVPLEAEQRVIGWINPQARYPLPGKVHTVFYRSLGA